MANQNQIDQIAERVERLLVRYAELQRTNALLTQQVDALTQEPNLVSALQRYEQERLQPTARIVLTNRHQGPEQCMQIVEERAPNGFTNLYDLISQAELEEIAGRYKQIAGFSRDELNAKQTA